MLIYFMFIIILTKTVMTVVILEDTECLDMINLLCDYTWSDMSDIISNCSPSDFWMS